MQTLDNGIKFQSDSVAEMIAINTRHADNIKSLSENLDQTRNEYNRLREHIIDIDG